MPLTLPTGDEDNYVGAEYISHANNFVLLENGEIAPVHQWCGRDGLPAESHEERAFAIVAINGALYAYAADDYQQVFH